MKKSNIIYFDAISYPLLPGEMFQLNMRHIGKLVHINHTNGESLFVELLMNQDDCLLMVSYSDQIGNIITLASKYLIFFLNVLQ